MLLSGDKDCEIRVCAILKSVIESGAPMETWEEKVRIGINVLFKVAGDHQQKLKKFEQGSS